MRKVILLMLVFGGQQFAQAQEETPKEYGAHENHEVEIQSEAHYPDGMNALVTKVYQEAPYSQEAIDAHVSGQVQVSFMVQADSSVTDIVVFMDTNPPCGPAVTEVLKTLKFAPAVENNTQVPMEMIVAFPVRAYKKQ